MFERPADRRPGDLPHRAGLLHRRAPPRARPRQRAGGGGDLQLDALRADRARVAHRSADRRCRTAARSIGSSKPGWRAPSAARAASASSSSTSIGSRRSTTPTATKPATARCARSGSTLRATVRQTRSVRAVRRRRVHRRAVGLQPGERGAAGARAADGRRRARRSNRGPACVCRCRSAPAPPVSRSTARRSTS